LPEALATLLPANTNVVQLVDFEHLMGYLDDVVDRCEPVGDPRNMNSWDRAELLRDDAPIDKIWRNLRALSTRLLRCTPRVSSRCRLVGSARVFPGAVPSASPGARCRERRVSC